VVLRFSLPLSLALSSASSSGCSPLASSPSPPIQSTSPFPPPPPVSHTQVQPSVWHHMCQFYCADFGVGGRVGGWGGGGGGGRAGRPEGLEEGARGASPPPRACRGSNLRHLLGMVRHTLRCLRGGLLKEMRPQAVTGHGPSDAMPPNGGAHARGAPPGIYWARTVTLMAAPRGSQGQSSSLRQFLGTDRHTHPCLRRPPRRFQGQSSSPRQFLGKGRHTRLCLRAFGNRTPSA